MSTIIGNAVGVPFSAPFSWSSYWTRKKVLDYTSRSGLDLLETGSGQNLNAKIIPSCGRIDTGISLLRPGGGTAEYAQSVEIEISAKNDLAITSNVTYSIVSASITDYIALRSATTFRVIIGSVTLTFARPNNDLLWHTYKIRFDQSGATTKVRVFFDGTESSTGVLDVGSKKPFRIQYLGGAGALIWHGRMSYFKLTDLDASSLLVNLPIIGHNKYEYDIVGDEYYTWSGTGYTGFDAEGTQYLLDSGYEIWSKVGKPDEYVPTGGTTTYIESLGYIKKRTVAGSVTKHNFAPSVIGFNETSSDNALLAIYDRSNETIHSAASRSSAFYDATSLATKSRFHSSELIDSYHFESLFNDGYQYRIMGVYDVIGVPTALNGVRGYSVNATGAGLTYLKNLNKSATWLQAMAESYYEINNHYTFSTSQKASITERLSEAYISTTFGYAGLAKRVCDFFIFFQNSNTTTALTERTITKTGETLRWNYGGGNIYSQNNLPAQINDGIITVTSADTFVAMTVFGNNSNSFTRCGLWNLGYYTPAIVNMYIQGNSMDGDLPTLYLAKELARISADSNDFTGKLTSPLKKTGRTDNELLVIDFWNNQLTGVEMNDFNPGMSLLKLSSNNIPTADLDALLASLNTFFSTYPPTDDCVIDLSKYFNGYITGGTSNADYLNLIAIWGATAYNLTITVNAGTSFDKGKVLITFDDGYNSNHDLGLAFFASKGITGTVYITTNYINTCVNLRPHHECMMNVTKINALRDAGWEIGAHSASHLNYATATEAQMIADADECLADFTALGMPAPTQWAYPFGGNNATSKTVISARFDSARLVDFYNAITVESDPYLLNCICIDAEILDRQPTFAEIKKYIDYANQYKVAIIFLAHGITETEAQIQDNYKVALTFLEEFVDYCQGAEVDVDIINVAQLRALMTP